MERVSEPTPEQMREIAARKDAMAISAARWKSDEFVLHAPGNGGGFTIPRPAARYCPFIERMLGDGS